MSAAIRFLAVAIIGWGPVRATTLGVLPGADLFTAQASEAAVPPIVATSLPPIEPVAGYAAMPDPGVYPPYAQAPYGYPAAAPRAYYYLPAAAPVSSRQPPVTPIAHIGPPIFNASLPQLDQWPLHGFASSAIPPRRSLATGSPEVTVAQMSKPRLDRLQLTAWALVRQEPGPASLSGNGMLGGSQAGARLSYHFNRQIAASLRTSSPVGGTARGGEVAAGVRIAPLRSIPVALTAERRQAFGRGGGRSAFALFLEGGVYQRHRMGLQPRRICPGRRGRSPLP